MKLLTHRSRNLIKIKIQSNIQFQVLQNQQRNKLLTYANPVFFSGMGGQRSFFNTPNQLQKDNEQLYKTLNLEKIASTNEIKKSFFTLAKQYHPDVNDTKEAKKKYLEIQDAYHTLTDPVKRKIYDKTGLAAAEQEEMGLNQTKTKNSRFENFMNQILGNVDPEGNKRSRTYEQMLEEYDRYFSLDQDLLRQEQKSINRSGSAMKVLRGGNDKGTNCFSTAEVDLAMVITGINGHIQYRRAIRCDKCKGKRVKIVQDEKKKEDCAECLSTGESQYNIGDICHVCLGTGKKSEDCMSCKGNGLVQQLCKLVVKIPKSVDNGMLLRIKDKGNQSLNGHYGDLIIQIIYEEHERFIRKGFDIQSELTIQLSQSIVGGTTTIETINGQQKVIIQPGTKHNDEIKIQGGGLSIKGSKHMKLGYQSGLESDRDDRDKGDHIVVVKINMPKDLSNQQKQLIENFQKTELKIK